MADTEVIGDTTEQMSTEDITTEGITTTEETPKEDITEEETQPSKTVKEELLKEETEEIKPDSVVQETVDENGDVFEETTQVTRKVVKRTMKITETSSSTKTTTMTTPAKLYGKDLSEYDEVDVDALLAQLSPEEINILAKEVDPDDNFLPPNQRCSYECTKDPTGPLNRKKLIEHINKEALETPDLPELEPFVKGTVRGKKWVPPPRDEREVAADEQIAIDLGDEYEHALSDATQEEIIDLAAILGFHSMMNQDQYHASLLNKGQPVGLGWDGITKSTQQKLYPMDPPNNTDVEESIKRVKDDDPKLIELNFNNIKNISDEKFEQLFDALPQNEHLEVLSLTNVGLTDKTALLLAEAIEKSKTLRVLNVETNFINPPVIVTLVKALLKARTIEEFRASNQRSTVLGNKIEMEITDLVEKNTSLLRLGLHLEFNDARHRVAAHLQRNIDRNEHELKKGTSSSPIPNATSIKTSVAAADTADDLSSLLSLQKTIKARSPKPMHIVLTPQERIDSKSELIASLARQKLSDRGRGEISLGVPQIGEGSRSPSKEKKLPVIVKERSPPTKSDKSPIRVKELSPKAVDSETEVKPKNEEHASSTRHPKIGELRNRTISKAIDNPSLSLQENGAPSELDKGSNVVTTLENGIEKPSKEDKGVATDTVITEQQNQSVEILNNLIQPCVDDSQTKISNDIVKPTTEVSLPLSNPMISATEPVIDVSSSTLPKVSETALLPKPEINVDRVQNISEIKLSAENVENPTFLVQTSQPELLQDSLKVSDGSSIDLSKNRDRLAESMSPSRHLEENMTLLRAKIDSFAEVADEKLTSLRSKFDNLPRDTSIDQTINTSISPSEDLKPLVKESKVNVEKSNDFNKLIDTVSQTTDLSVLLPNAPPKSVTIPPKPLVKTPNSVGITCLWRATELVMPILPKAAVDRNKVEPSENINSKDTVQPLPSEIEKPSPILVSETNPNITDQGTELKDSKPNNPSKDSIKPNPEKPTHVTSIPSSDSTKPKSKESTPMATNPGTESIKLVVEQESDKIITTADNLGTTNAINPTINLPSVTTSPPVITKAQALNKLCVKKGDPLQINPIKTVDTGTQPPAQPSPLSRLSVKKGDSQKIDPIKTTDVGTQSPVKPNPLSFLTVRRRDLVEIAPALRSEVSTQSEVEPRSDVSSQTIDEEPIQTIEESTQTPLIFSSLEHDYVFPGLRHVPHLPRPKTVNIGGGDRVVIKPSSKSINEVLMLLYPALQDYRNVKPQETVPLGKNFGLEEDLIKDINSESTIKDLEETIQNAMEASDVILKSEPKTLEDVTQPDENVTEETNSIKTEIEIPLAEEANSLDDCERVSTATRYETKFTAVEKVSALSRTTIESEEHVKVIDKAYKSVAEVTSSEEKHVSKTSIRSANMWESLSSNLIKASEQTLIDISKAANLGETVSSTRTKIGKVSVYSSVEDLSHSTHSKYSDRRFGGIIKTVEKTSVYSSTEDLPVTAYTRYSDRYGNDHTKNVSKSSVYSSTEDLPQYSRTNYSDRYESDLAKSKGKASVYSSTEDLAEIPYTKYSDRYSNGKPTQYSIDTSRPYYMPNEDLSLLPLSKFSDRYKDDQVKSLDTHRSHPKFPVSSKLDRSYHKSADHLISRSQYKSADDYLHKTKVDDRAAHEVVKSHDSSLQTAILSSISRNQSALRPYTYVPTSIYTGVSIDHVRSRPSSPAAIHTSTLQLNISPSGISELPSTRFSKYVNRDSTDKPKIIVSRARDENRSFRAISPIDRSRPSANLLSPYRKVSDHANNDLIDKSSQPTLDISSASAASTAEYNASTTTTTTSTPNTTPKKRVNVMETIKMLKNRVRDVITTEDRFSETHRLTSSSSIVSSSQSSGPSRGARTNARTTSSSLIIPHDNDEKEV